MSGQHPVWLGAVAAGVMTVSLGMHTRLFMRPELKARCSACRRLYWRAHVRMRAGESQAPLEAYVLK